MSLTKAQTLSLLQAAVDFRQVLRAFLVGDFTTKMNALSSAIDAGDDTPETAAQKDALDSLWASAEALWSDTSPLMDAMATSLGRYAGSPQLGSVQHNIAYFHAQLHADSEAIVSRGLTKFSSWTADGSNAGNGDFVVHNNDIEGQSMDVSHIETLTLRCTRSEQEGATRGAETFTVKGSDAGRRQYEEQGSQTTGGYQWTMGLVDEDWATGDRSQPTANVGSTIIAAGVSRNAGNILFNGDFAAALGSGSTKIGSYTIDAGEANVALNDATAAFGSQSLQLTGNAKLRQLLDRSGTGRMFALQAYGQRAETVTDGELTIKVLDDDTTHATITVDVSSSGITHSTWTKGGVQAFALPASVGANLRVEIELAAYDGSGNVLVDGVMLVPLTLIDGRGIGIIQGITPWRRNDRATGATTVSETGKIQREINQAFGRYLRHAGSATYWSDPT